MSDPAPAHDHVITWAQTPYLIWGNTACYVGTCRYCPATFQREAPADADPACGQCRGSGYVQRQIPGSHGEVQMRCECARP